MPRLGKRLFIVCLLLEAGLLAWQWYDFGSLSPAESELPAPLVAIKQVNVHALVNGIIEHNIWASDRQPVVAKEQLTHGELGNVQRKLSWNLLALGRARDGVLVVAIAITHDPASMKYYRVGDGLPDGTVLLEIFDDGIKYADGDKTTTLYMFGRE